MDYISKHLNEINEAVSDACAAVGKKREAVTLIGVTKTYEPEVINAAIAYGLTDIAENRVQEILRKYDFINGNIRWHLIGHLQTNKVKYIIDKVDLIHSVDSDRLADEIQKRAKQINKVQDVLIQINVAGETQKSGIAPEALPDLLEHVAKLPNVRVCGLMNIAPFDVPPNDLRADFKKMKMLFDSLMSYGYDNVKAEHLSMGMSGDFVEAILEGATMIRVGTKIFGRRL